MWSWDDRDAQRRPDKLASTDRPAGRVQIMGSTTLRPVNAGADGIRAVIAAAAVTSHAIPPCIYIYAPLLHCHHARAPPAEC